MTNFKSFYLRKNNNLYIEFFNSKNQLDVESLNSLKLSERV